MRFCDYFADNLARKGWMQKIIATNLVFRCVFGVASWAVNCKKLAGFVCNKVYVFFYTFHLYPLSFGT